MKKIIDVGENDMLAVIDRSDGSFSTIFVKNLPDYVEPKDEAKEEPSLYPAIGTTYYFISAYGQVLPSIFEGCEEDIEIFDIGNGFLTKEEAEFEVERRKTIAKMKLYAESIPAKWDWMKKHWRIDYSFFNKFVYITDSISCICGELYFSSEEQARKAIEAVGEENVKKYYLGVI